MSTETLSKEIGGWEAVITNIKARLPELPQLGPTVQELEGVVIEGKAPGVSLRTTDVRLAGCSFWVDRGGEERLEPLSGNFLCT